MHGHTDWFGDTADVRVWDGMIPQSELESLVQHIRAHGFKYGWKSDDDVEYGHWNHSFAGKNKKNRDPVESYLDPTCSVVVSRMKQFMPANARIIRCYANCYTFATEGYPHVDSEHPDDITAIIYLNHHWDRRYGGETVFYSGDEIIKSVVPKFGRMIMFHSDLVHAARGVTRVCPEARMVFVVKAKTND